MIKCRFTTRVIKLHLRVVKSELASRLARGFGDLRCYNHRSRHFPSNWQLPMDTYSERGSQMGEEELEDMIREAQPHGTSRQTKWAMNGKGTENHIKIIFYHDFSGA